MCTCGDKNRSNDNINNTNHNFEGFYFMFVNQHICVICDLVYVIFTVGIDQTFLHKYKYT